MESNIPRLLLILIFFILPAPLYAQTPDQNISMVVQVYESDTWQRARNYCQNYYTDLVTIRNKEEANNLTYFGGWIGLRKNKTKWKWSQNGELASFFNWNSSEQSEPGDVNCVMKNFSSSKWIRTDCKDRQYFLCINENMILVQEMKTWEEALLYCNKLPSALNSTYHHNLACLPDPRTLVWNREKIAQTVTHEVWIGLRFLAGHWVWTNGAMMKSPYLPQCPAQDQHCGALDLKNGNRMAMNCTEKRHFLCSL